MQLGENLHEMSKPIFSNSGKYIINMSSAESEQRAAKFNDHNDTSHKYAWVQVLYSQGFNT